MFIGFSCDQHRLARMLARMAGAEDGIRDALTRYTTAVSGAYYFVPSVEALRAFASSCGYRTRDGGARDPSLTLGSKRWKPAIAKEYEHASPAYHITAQRGCARAIKSHKS